MDLSNLRSINELKALKQEDQGRHQALVKGHLDTQETILRSFKALVDYLEHRVGRTEVVNQLKEVGTPDALKVVDAVNELHSTLKTHENTDLSGITEVMQAVLEQAKQIPKELPELKIPEAQDYSAQFKSLVKAVESVEKVVKAQKLIAEAPVVNVPETQVNVEAPDLKPLQDATRDVVKAVKGIVIPQAILDTKPVEKLLKSTNKLLNDLLEKPVSSGGGGSGRATPYEANGVPQFVELVDGKVPVQVEGLTLDLDGATINVGNEVEVKNDSGNPVPISASSLPLPTGAATSARQDTEISSLSSIDTKLSSQATATKQDTGNTSLSSIDTKLSTINTKQTDGTQKTQAAGDVAHDAVDSGSPVKIGGKATTSVPTAVSATGDRTDAWFDQWGRQVISDQDVELGLSVGTTGLRDRLTAERYTILSDSLADGINAFWTSTTSSGGTTTSTGGEGVISTSANASGSAQLVSTVINYYPGQVGWFNSAVRMSDAGSAGNVRRIGVFTVSGTTPQNGFYYELNGTTLNAVVVKAGTPTATASTSWSRAADAPFTLDANFHSFEIRYTANTVWFYVDNILRHRVSGTNAAITTTLDFSMVIQSINSSGATDRYIAVRNCGVGGFGNPATRVNETGLSAVWSTPVGGGTPHDSVDSGNPIKFGGYAKANAPSAVQDGDRVNAWFNKNGALNIVDGGGLLATAAKQDQMLTYLDNRYGGGKTAVNFTVTASGDTTIHTPTSGKYVRLYSITAITDPDESTTPLIKVLLGSTEVRRGYAISGWEISDGAVNDVLKINLSGASSVSGTAFIKEITP